MPYRFVKFFTGEIYHVFNRSVARQPIFPKERDYQRALELIDFYRFNKPQLRFSQYNLLPFSQREDFMDRLYTKETMVEIIAFCIMPNHIHFLLRQKIDNGIPTFMRVFQNSYAKYFNTKNKRSGALFQSMFKGVRIEDDDQFVHVARYIHLNPLTSFVLQKPDELEIYPWSSFMDYAGKRSIPFLEMNTLKGLSSSMEKFKEFTFDQVEYQRKLETIKHLLLEDS